MLEKEIRLCKWWKTKSARAAFRRVEKQRKERIAKVRATFAAKQKALYDLPEFGGVDGRTGRFIPKTKRQ